MIKARFLIKDGSPAGFAVSGHAGYATAGNDIVCAAVSSAAQMTVNTVTEVFKVPAIVIVGHGAFSGNMLLRLPQSGELLAAQAVLTGMRLHLLLLSRMYEGYITVQDCEV